MKPDMPQRILSILAQKRRVSYKELSKELAVSLPTVRKNTEPLLKEKVAASIYGGVEYTKDTLSSGTKEFNAIAREAVKLITNGDSIYLGPGRTVSALCPYLKDIKELTVFTNSLLIINTLSVFENITVFAIGGQLERSNMAFTLYQNHLEKIHISKAFISATSIDPDLGIFHRVLANKNTEEIVSANAKQLVFLASKDKFEIHGTFIVMPIEAVHILISTEDLPDTYIQKLKAKHIDVRLAPLLAYKK